MNSELNAELVNTLHRKKFSLTLYNNLFFRQTQAYNIC